VGPKEVHHRPLTGNKKKELAYEKKEGPRKKGTAPKKRKGQEGNQTQRGKTRTLMVQKRKRKKQKGFPFLTMREDADVRLEQSLGKKVGLLLGKKRKKRNKYSGGKEEGGPL